jgi:hypothetical protein
LSKTPSSEEVVPSEGTVLNCKSFSDFITGNSSPFQLDLPAIHRKLAISCFRIMQAKLHFNMGGHHSQSLTNKYPCKVAQHITYACFFIFLHIENPLRQVPCPQHDGIAGAGKTVLS